MSSKIKDLNDCTCGRDYWQLCEQLGLKPEKVGSYWRVESNGVCVHWPDSDRTMPKETRALINWGLVKTGLVVATLAGILLAWVVM